MNVLKKWMEDRLGCWARPVQFGLVGLSGMVPDMLSFSLLLLWLPLPLARAGAICLAVTWNFSLNRNLTFAEARDQSIVKQYVLYFGCSLTGAVVSWLTFVILCLSWHEFARWPLMAAVAGIGSGAVINYLLSRNIAFRFPSSNPSPLCKESPVSELYGWREPRTAARLAEAPE